MTIVQFGRSSLDWNILLGLNSRHSVESTKKQHRVNQHYTRSTANWSDQAVRWTSKFYLSTTFDHKLDISWHKTHQPSASGYCVALIEVAHRWLEKYFPVSMKRHTCSNPLTGRFSRKRTLKFGINPGQRPEQKSLYLHFCADKSTSDTFRRIGSITIADWAICITRRQ